MKSPGSLATNVRLLLWILTLALPLSIASQTAVPTEDAFARALGDRMPGLLAKYGVPGAVVSCIDNGAVVWT